MAQGGIRDGSSGGIAGDHPPPDPLPFLVGSATGAEFNTAHLPLIPIACWGVDDVRFAFDSSFVTMDCSGGGAEPEDIRVEMAILKDLVTENPGCPLSLFGHADPVGTDVYNKSLSERRATAIYALMIFNTDAGTAVSLWQTVGKTENWGANQQQVMQTATGSSASALDSGMLQAYMKQLCATGPSLAKTDFLAQGADSSGKGDYQGCSEFNPLVLFSQEKEAAFEQAKANNDADGIAARNAANAPNRRVLGLMFRKGSKVDPAKWPCPRASQGISGCIDRFWSDGQARRSTLLPGQDRLFQETLDTFGCRFYQRLSEESPCEATIGLVHISNILHLNYPAPPLANYDYELTLTDRVVTGNTGADGFVGREKVPAGDYKLEVAGRTTYVSAIPLSLSRLDWILDTDSANGYADPANGTAADTGTGTATAASGAGTGGAGGGAS